MKRGLSGFPLSHWVYFKQNLDQTFQGDRMTGSKLRAALVWLTSSSLFLRAGREGSNGERAVHPKERRDGASQVSHWHLTSPVLLDFYLKAAECLQTWRGSSEPGIICQLPVSFASWHMVRTWKLAIWMWMSRAQEPTVCIWLHLPPLDF